MEALKTIVAEVLAEAQASGATITAASGALPAKRSSTCLPMACSRKEAIMAMINVVFESGGSGAGGNGAGRVRPERRSRGGKKAAVAALEDEDSGPTRAALLVAGALVSVRAQHCGGPVGAPLRSVRGLRGGIHQGH